MIKVTLALLLVGALVVNPGHSCKPADTVSFFKELNENYQLVERVKAAAGEISSSKVPCFNTLSLDTALFSADVFTDVANGLNLYYGPDPNATLNQTEGDDGRIRKAHPVWGVLMLTIPFLPMFAMMAMMVFAPMLADEEIGIGTKIGFALVAIPLSLVFSAVATPVYVLFVLGVGICRVVGCGCVGEDSKATQGGLKTLEVSLESAIQTCLGE